MPYKDPQRRKDYQKGYHAGYRKATIDHLGGKCEICGTTSHLHIHHPEPIKRQSRNHKDWKDLSKCRIRCEIDHEDSPMRFRKKNV